MWKLSNIFLGLDTTTQGRIRRSRMESGFPGGSVVKNLPAKQGTQCKGHAFNPWVGKIPWRKKWQPTPIFLPGKSHGQRSLAGCSPWGRKRVGHKLKTNNNNKEAYWFHWSFKRKKEKETPPNQAQKLLHTEPAALFLSLAITFQRQWFSVNLSPHWLADDKLCVCVSHVLVNGYW